MKSPADADYVRCALLAGLEQVRAVIDELISLLQVPGQGAKVFALWTDLRTRLMMPMVSWVVRLAQLESAPVRGGGVAAELAGLGHHAAAGDYRERERDRDW